MIRIFDADKKPVTAEIQRTDRVDVNQLFEEAKNPGKQDSLLRLRMFPENACM